MRMRIMSVFEIKMQIKYFINRQKDVQYVTT